MNPTLDAKLCERYPEIFRDRHAPKDQTAMCWGFDCGDGWYALIDELCAELMEPANEAKRAYETACNLREELDRGTADDWVKRNQELYSPEQIQSRYDAWQQALVAVPVASQVKQKFGSLCFYVQSATDKQFELIRFAERLSTRMCETCGTTANVTRGEKGWIQSLCGTCRNGHPHSIGEPTDDALWGV